MPDFSPETALIIACARRIGGTAARALIRERAGRRLDWQRLIQLAAQHHMLALVQYNLQRWCADLVLGAILSALKSWSEKNRRHNQVRTEALLELLRALRERDIPVIPFKGPLLALQVYGDVGLRTFRDLDLLFERSCIWPALDVLRELGYTSTSHLTPVQQQAFWDYSGQDIVFHKTTGIGVEPHWAFAPTTLALDLDYEALWRRSQTVALDGVQVRVLMPEDVAMVLCLHGSKERWTRLQWICDVAEFIHAYPQTDWDLVVTQAAQQGCRRMVALGLLLAQRVLGAPLPRELALRLYADQTALRLVAQIEHNLASEATVSFSLYRLSAFHLGMRERWRDRFRYCLRTSFTPREIHFRLVVLPDRLILGYYPVKVLHDYLLLPVWNAVKRLRRFGNFFLQAASSFLVGPH